MRLRKNALYFFLASITDLKDGTLLSIYNKLSLNEIYSMIIQIIYALYLMHSNDFYHTDLHGGNIMYNKTNNKSIKILNFNLPTFGYIWIIIDYGLIESPRFKYSHRNRLKKFIYRNHSYEDIIGFLCEGIFNWDPIIGKIVSNIKLSNKEIKIHFTKLNYEDTKKYCKYANNPIKIIKYFYSKLRNNLA